VDHGQGDFRVVLNPEYKPGLLKLNSFRYMYVLYHIHRVRRKTSMVVTPPWTAGAKIGLFASRSPLRPNPIGLSIVRIKEIIDNEIVTSGIDAFDRTPVLDIKPYVKDLDSKPDANYGWLNGLGGDEEHLLLHIRGVPHEY
jgi:tRNA-Thr(GGU) m(6)t(6)A37 methyltransferase TsaA